MPPMSMPPSHRLIVLYGVGGLSDVGRHAVQVALDLQQQQSQQHEEASGAAPGAPPALASSSLSSSSSPIRITVLTKFPDLLLEDNWNCGCPEPHSVDVVKLAASAGEDGISRQARLDVIKVTDWKDASLRAHFAAPSPTSTTTTVISCLGNRQTFGPNDASEAMEHLILPAMRQHGVQRLVCLTSVGVEEDWPPLEFFAVGRVALSCMFKTVSRRAFRDLTKMERLVRGAASDSADSKDNKDGGGGNIDFLLVRPVGIGEDVKPEGRWQLQKEKFNDRLGYDMAKLDVARFMVTQALHPTLHGTAVVVGAVLDEKAAQKWE